MNNALALLLFGKGGTGETRKPCPTVKMSKNRIIL